MADTIKERNEIEDKYKWDLTVLYKDDEAWEAELVKLDGEIEKLAAYEGKLKDAKSIASYYEASVEFDNLLSDLFAYALMRKSEDTRQEAAQGMYARIYGKYVQALTALSFADPEILSLPQETLEEMKDDPALAEYRMIFIRLLRNKPHTLTSAEEALLASFGEVFAAPRNVANNLQDADMTFEGVRDSQGKEYELTGSNYILLQSSPDRQLRENSFRSFYKSYKGHINTFAAAYAGAVKAATAEAAARRYASSLEMAAAAEDVPTVVYDQLIQAVHKMMPQMHRYVSLRKKMLGVDELHYYDLYAPLAEGTPRSYSYEEAKDMVLEAVSVLGEEYVNTVKDGMANGWIDVYPNKGKEGGAYSESTYHSNPYIMMNFTGTLDSVSTLAHEMGHSMHSWHSNHHQPAQYANYTLFVAEVASTVNENLLVEQLLENCKDKKEKLALLNQYLEGFKGTVYRQTMFAEFEKEAHAMAERGEALHAASLSALYRRLIEEYFGPELVIDDEVELEWARIPHFYRPFYVYKYATSYCAAVALSESILKEGEKAAKRYREFLSMGSSRDPLDELRHAGVDFATEAPMIAALEKFGRVIDETEEMLK